MSLLRAILTAWRPSDGGSAGRDVTIVSGLPRSGTSMMMKMLEAGGLPALTDRVREADEDNPKGYYELERVRRLRDGDAEWVAEARGRAVKVISELLRYLPAEHDYRVVFMRRDLKEILASQRRMLAHRGTEADDEADARLAGLYERHLEEVEGWLSRQSNMQVLYVSYNDVLARPRESADRIDRFLGGRLRVDRMAAVIDPALYRQRA